MVRKCLSILLVGLIAIAALVFLIHVTAAASPNPAVTPKIGCNPYNLTVKTGQTFYITVAVSDTTDLYAWQLDATYYPDYLEYVRLVPGNHLRSDGTSYYLVKPGIVTGTTTNEMRLAAYTRLSKNSGADGSGNIAHFFFRALKPSSGTNVTLNDIILVDRNALEITKSLINTGRCRVIISDSAAELNQDVVGELEFLPVIRH